MWVSGCGCKQKRISRGANDMRKRSLLYRFPLSDFSRSRQDFKINDLLVISVAKGHLEFHMEY